MQAEAFQTPPYAMLKETTTKLAGNDRFEGFGIDLIKELSAMLAFNYTFMIQEDGQNGNFDRHTKTWNGMIGEIIEDVTRCLNAVFRCSSWFLVF